MGRSYQDTLATEDIGFQPKQIRKEYEAEYGQYRIYPTYNAEEDAIREYVSVAECRRNMAEFLDKQYDWDFMAVQFQVTDSIFHDLEDRAKIRQILKQVDSFVGDIINLADDEASIFIASDHGMGDYDWTFYANSWLAEQGYCETKKGEAQYFRQQKSKLKGEKGGKPEKDVVGMAVGTIADTFSQIGLSPQRIHRGLSKVGLAKTVERLLPEQALVAAQNQVVDHENSTAFQLYFNSLGIRLNVRGREPAGIVSKSGYEDVRSEIIEKLRTVRDPDGNLVFDDVVPREDIYTGKHLEDAPDIILVPRDYQYDVSGSILDTFRRNEHKNHKPEGILLSNRELNVCNGTQIYDIAPTIAAELGLPIDRNTDGRILVETDQELEEENWDEIASEHRDRRSNDNTSNVEDRLADLGYME